MIKQSVSPSTSQTPPGPKGYPIVGCLPYLMGDRIQFLTNAAHQYGDVVDLGSIGPQKLYLITHPDYLKYVIQENPQNYIKGANFQDESVTMMFGKGLVSSEGDFWRRNRRMVQPAFHRQQIGALVNVMTKITEQMLEQWRHFDHNQPVNVSAQMLEVTQKIIIRAVLSLEADSKQSKAVIDSWTTGFAMHCERIWALFKLPVSFPTPKNRKFLQAVRTLDQVIHEMIQQRRQSNDDSGDILSMLLDARDDSGNGMSEEQLRDEISTLIGAGFETSGVSLSWVWYLLSQHPEAEQKLHQELAEVLGGRTPTLEDLPKLKYTKMVIEEAMRLYPAVWINSRSNIADDQIGGYHIPANTMIMLCPFITHRRPDVWENPEKFEPERFSQERSIGRPRYAYFPFGGGPRQCLGDVFAMTEMQLILAMVAQQFRLRLVPQYQLEIDSRLTLRPAQGIQMILEPRSDANVSPSNTQQNYSLT